MRPIRTILLATAATAALMLSACSNTPPSQPSETEGSPSALSGSIEVWVMGNKGPLLEELSADFTRETGVAVEIQAVPWGEVRAKMSTAIVSGEGPDVLQVGLDRMAEWSEAGGLLELSDIISQHPSLAADNFLPASASTMDYDGEIFTVPWLSDTRTLFYRTDLLAAAGFDAAPATWDDWLAAAKVLTERGGRNYGMGFN
ncbi:MAG: extracellular solute-binding protein, partial [Propionibacteriaceae bacterium]|nr:extracellular solute-binding protein [Propionibacteriaceae bacterium]